MGFRATEKFIYRVWLQYKIQGRRDFFTYNTGVVINQPKLELAVEKAKNLLIAKSGSNVLLDIEPVSVEKKQDERYF